MSVVPALGIIGGSGLYKLSGFEFAEELDITTPFGSTSDKIRIADLDGHRVAFLSRHGQGHRLSPSEVPYAANIFALKSLGVSRVLSVSAVGSLAEEIVPRSFVIPDDLIDRTVNRRRTLFGDGIVAHVSMADPFCANLSAQVALASRQAGTLPVLEGGTYVCIEGPQFSTRAEIFPVSIVGRIHHRDDCAA